MAIIAIVWITAKICQRAKFISVQSSGVEARRRSEGEKVDTLRFFSATEWWSHKYLEMTPPPGLPLILRVENWDCKRRGLKFRHEISLWRNFFLFFKAQRLLLFYDSLKMFFGDEQNLMWSSGSFKVVSCEVEFSKPQKYGLGRNWCVEYWATTTFKIIQIIYEMNSF